MAIFCRLLVAAVLFGTWGVMIANGQADPAPMVDFIKLTLGGLAGYVLMKGNDKP